MPINDRGEILAFCLTSGNVDDCNREVLERLTREMYGKLFADRGYLSVKLFEKLWERKIQHDKLDVVFIGFILFAMIFDGI